MSSVLENRYGKYPFKQEPNNEDDPITTLSNMYKMALESALNAEQNINSDEPIPTELIKLPKWIREVIPEIPEESGIAASRIIAATATIVSHEAIKTFESVIMSRHVKK